MFINSNHQSPMCQQITHNQSLPAIVKEKSKHKPRFPEIAGRTTAECVAICCCCPCSIFSILILLALRLPKGLCRWALRKRMRLQRAEKRAARIGSGIRGSSHIWWSTTAVEGDLDEFAGLSLVMLVGNRWPERSPAADARALEMEVWSEFTCRGFWRSQSGREEDS
ncbi:hypothetical protein MA16_Dca026127 [Dendrobium catenatum]|uniref:Uncharacterized protein n=2 Tax=Dendrobium catenatum TaxID=906689 RepID=A0A2I0VAH9_9ASPA|nr:hypothetical protein MA16_Dca026127 [Dendrobium catenatum]